MKSVKSLLEGLAVVDLSVGMVGALATKFLVDAGAHVRRVEPPDGDPFYEQYPAYEVWQRGKQVALARHEGEIDELLNGTAVCVIGGEDHPDLLWRHDAEALARRHPGVVILNFTGYPAGTPHAKRPAVDILVQARSGMAFEQYSDRPLCHALPAPTYGAALLGLAGLFAALVERKRSGVGQIVEASLFSGALSWCVPYWFQAEQPSGAFNSLMPRDVRGLIFRCADERYLHFTLGTAGAKGHVYRLLGIDDPTLAQDDRGLPSAARGPKNFYGDIDLLQSYLSTWQSTDFLEALWAVGLPAEPVLRPGECWDDEQMQHNGVVVRDEDGMRHVGLPVHGRVIPQEASRSRTAAAGTLSAATSGAGPLAGVRVLDFGNFVAGPHGSVMLGDLGADVIKVESLGGDPMRPYFRAFTGSNRGKRGLAVDLKTTEGVAIAHRLCASAHIVHHNFRPGVAERIGIDVAILGRINPRLIVVETSGYGSEGPKAQRGGLDMVLQAVCGHEHHAAGKGNPPMCYRLTVVDYTAGLLGAIASLMAYANQMSEQGGAALSTNLLSSGVFLLSELIQRPSGEFAGTLELNAAQTGMHPAEQFYRTTDGWVAVAARSDAMARALTDVLGLSPRLNAPRARWGEAEARMLAEAIAPWKTAELVARLEAHGVWIEEGRADAAGRTLDDPVLRRAGVTITGKHAQYGEFMQLGALVGLSRSELRPRSLAPSLGEHTRSILAELGYTDAEIEDFYRRRIVA